MLKDVGWTKNIARTGQVTLTDTLKATRDRDAWKVMIAYAKEHGT